MMGRALAIVLLTSTAGATAATADPITAVYDVQVFERFFGQGGEFRFEPFHRQFTLSMTFDPATATRTSTYGPPLFSAVPLSIPSAPDDLTLASAAGTTHERTSEGGAFARATAGIFGGKEVAGNLTVYSAEIQLLGGILAGTPEAIIDAETFPIHLGTPFRDFNFFHSACLGIGPFPPGADSCTDAQTMASSHVTYFGRATLRDVDHPAIPEPATIALVGGGLAVLARGRRRSRNRSPSSFGSPDQSGRCRTARPAAYDSIV